MTTLLNCKMNENRRGKGISERDMAHHISFPFWPWISHYVQFKDFPGRVASKAMRFGAFFFFLPFFLLPQNELLKMCVKLNSKSLGFSRVQSTYLHSTRYNLSSWDCCNTDVTVIRDSVTFLLDTITNFPSFWPLTVKSQCCWYMQNFIPLVWGHIHCRVHLLLAHS